MELKNRIREIFEIHNANQSDSLIDDICHITANQKYNKIILKHTINNTPSLSEL